MPEEVIGFLTTDGAFYHTKAQAERHEYAQQIVGLCESHTPKPIDPGKFFILIEAWADTIRNYINANEACKQESVSQEDTSRANWDQADDTIRDAKSETLEQQPTGRPVPVPNMGDRTQPKGISEFGSVNGFGSRGDDA